jgi:hypothetical protein
MSRSVGPTPNQQFGRFSGLASVCYHCGLWQLHRHFEHNDLLSEPKLPPARALTQPCVQRVAATVAATPRKRQPS